MERINIDTINRLLDKEDDKVKDFTCVLNLSNQLSREISVTDVIDEEIRLCGYFVIITSKKMTAEEALDLYKSRDASEKLFKGDKSYLGNKSFRVQSNESVRAKIFIEFVALIVRNRFHKYLKERMVNSERKFNFMTVPAAVRELEKIEMLRQPDGSYRLDHAVTATQKEILKAFNMTATNIREQAIGINEDLRRCEGEN